MEVSSPPSQAHVFSRSVGNRALYVDPSVTRYEKFVMTGDVMLQVKSLSPENPSPITTSSSRDSHTNITAERSITTNDEQTYEGTTSPEQSQPTNSSSNGSTADVTPLGGVEKDSAAYPPLTDNTRVLTVNDGDSPDSPIVKVDEPSAQRLAKRLFNLDGFKRSDVAHHLTRDNQFSRKVNEEYFKYFDFTDLSLLDAMRMFFEQFALVGETQERERVLNHFTHRYLHCNPSTLATTYYSHDSCHTLTCALMLLNTDLHAKNLNRRMVMPEFMENLSGLNGSDDFPAELLKSFYMSIKQQPLAWATDEAEGNSGTDAELANAAGNGAATQPSPQHSSVSLSFLNIPSHQDAIEFKRGSLQKKHCNGPDLKPVASGKRGWKKHYVILKGMALYLLKSSGSQIDDKTTKVILLHHSLAQVARLYKRKPCVFSLQTAEWSEYLFSASDVDELSGWVNSINLAAALLSAEPLAAGVGSQKRFRRPLLPSSPTTLSLSKQFKSHEKRLRQIHSDIAEEENYRPDRKSSSKLDIANYNEKMTFLKFELQRYMIYASLLKDKIDQEVGENQTSIDEEGEEGQSENIQKAMIPPAPPRRPGTNRYSYQQAMLHG